MAGLSNFLFQISSDHDSLDVIIQSNLEQLAVSEGRCKTFCVCQQVIGLKEEVPKINALHVTEFCEFVMFGDPGPLKSN